TQFDLRPYMESDHWPQIYAGIQQHLQKIYNGKKAALKERYWVLEEDGSYDLERLRRGRPSYIYEDDMLRLQGLGSNTPTGVPYTRDEHGHDHSSPISSATQLRDIARLNEGEGWLTNNPGSGGCGDDEPGDDEDDGEDRRMRTGLENSSTWALNSLRLKLVGPAMSPGNIAREGIPFELFRSTYPGRHVARETYPQRQVARDTPDLSLGNIANVVVNILCFHPTWFTKLSG
ncbi:hypothetical protein Tco_0491848, partial [Tanacetum coccineum]